MAEGVKTGVFKSFLLSVRHQFFVFIVMAAVFFTIFILNGLPWPLYLYSLELGLFFFVIYLIIQYYSYSRRFKAITQPGFKSGELTDDMPVTDPADRIYLGRISQLQQENRELMNLHAQRQADQLDYFTL